MATPEEIRENIRRLSSFGEPQKEPEPKLTNRNRVWTPAGFEDKPPGWKEDPDSKLPEAPPQPKTGPRGGRYTEAKTKDGRPYRRYY